MRILGRGGVEVAIAAFFLALAAVATRPLVLHADSTTIAGYDPLTHLWTIHWLVEHFFDRAQIFQGNTYHPEPHAVLYTEIDLGTVVLLLPFRHFLRDPVPLFNAGTLLALAFGAWSFHLLVRSLTGQVLPGIAGGVLAGFSSNQIRHIPHVDVLTIGWLALFLLCLHRIAAGGSWIFVPLCAGSFALTMQSSGYSGVAAGFLALVLPVVFPREALRPPALLKFSAATVLCVLLLAPYARAFLSLRARGTLHRGLGFSEHLSFHPTEDLGSKSLLWGALLGRRGECLFPGVLCLSLAGFALVRPRRREALYYALGGLVLVLVSLGPRVAVGRFSLWLPYRLLVSFPPLDSMRHPQSFAGIALLDLAVLAGLGLAKLRPGPVLGAAFVAAAVLETLAPAPRLQDVPRGVPPIYSLLEALPPGPVLEVPVFADEVLLFAARVDRPFVNGQLSSLVPRATWQLDDFIAKNWLRTTPYAIDRSNSSFFFDNYDVRYLVLPRGRISLEGMGALTRSMERSPCFSRVAQSPDGDRIYEVRSWRPNDGD